MSLVSASGLIGNTKEYIYRGIQQLPLIMSLTSFMMTITTGSIAHATLFGGLTFVMPIFTLLFQYIIGNILLWFMPEGKGEWSRSMVDVCKIIPSPESFKKLEYYAYGSNTNISDIPSYWITSIGFIFGYFIMNGVDTLDVPVLPGADPIAHTKRYTKAIHILAATSIIFTLIVISRFYFMGDCEGRGNIGRALGVFFGIVSVGIGVGFYYLSKTCGARSSDLFGVLSQMLPASAMSPTPIACTKDPSEG
jgi:hypothetical protein